MLSRVAENIYWMARYVERAENSARLVLSHVNLLMDLPRSTNPGWAPLIAITGSAEQYLAAHEGYAEREVTSWMIRERAYAGSIVCSLAAARENCRTIRDVLPRLAWEYINELQQSCEAALKKGLNKNARPALLRQVIQGAQAVSGLLAGSMNHDEGYDFLRIGTNIERADMTTRIIDVNCRAALAPDLVQAGMDDLLWNSMLKSLSGDQMFRRETRTRVTRAAALGFLFRSTAFPRSFHFAVNTVERSVSRLPLHRDLRARCAALKASVQQPGLAQLAPAELSAFVDELQLGLGGLHEELYARYFAAPVLKKTG